MSFGDVIGAIGLIVGILGILPLYFKRVVAVNRIKEWIGQGSTLVNATINSCSDAIQILDEERLYNILVESGLQRALDDGLNIRFEDAEPPIPILFKKVDYQIIQQQFSLIRSIESNLVSYLELFEREYSKHQNTIAKQLNLLLKVTDEIISSVRSNKVLISDREFIEEFDRIISTWQRSSPEIVNHIASGEAVNPYVLNQKLFTPLGDLCRTHMSFERATEIMSIVREFGLAFSSLNREKGAFKNALISERSRLRQVLKTLNHSLSRL